MEIVNKPGETKGFYEATEDGHEAGRMYYTWAGKELLIIDHTEVNPEFRGQGVGKELVLAVVNDARKNHYKILPLCPFAKSLFDRTSEIRDVL